MYLLLLFYYYNFLCSYIFCYQHLLLFSVFNLLPLIWQHFFVEFIAVIFSMYQHNLCIRWDCWIFVREKDETQQDRGRSWLYVILFKGYGTLLAFTYIQRLYCTDAFLKAYDFNKLISAWSSLSFYNEKSLIEKDRKEKF